MRAGLIRKYLNLTPFVQNVLFVFFTQAVVVFAGGASNIILARLLGPEGKGIVYLAVLVPQVLFVFFSLGMLLSTIYFTAKKRYPVIDIVSNSLFVAFFVSIIVGVIYFLLLPYLSRSILKNIDIGFLRLTFFIFPIMLITACLSGVPYGLQQIKKGSSIDILKTASKLMLIVLFVFLFKMGVNGAIVAIAVSFMAGLALAVFWVLKISPIRIRMNPGITKGLVKFGLKNHFGTIAQFLNHRFDMFLVNLFLTTASVGIYSVSVLIAELIAFVPLAVQRVFYPKIAASDIRIRELYTTQACRNTLFITLFLGAVLFFASRPLVLFFFGKQFASSLLPLRILLPGVAAMSVIHIISSDLIARGRPLYVTYTTIPALILNIILNIFLIPGLALPGAALASTITYVASAVVLSSIYSRVSGNRWREFLCIRKEDLAIYRSLFRSIL